jgi:cell fate regulator YaaT (PSP1 superfamily)
MVYYIGDIFIFSKNMEDHECHVNLVLEKFREVGLNVKLENCEIYKSQVEFLNYIIFRDDICMDPHKVQTIVS